jgi:DNA adenine methylase
VTESERDNEYLKAPFVYFGGKSTVAPVVWERIGYVKHYLEPFCGSCAMLLKRPDLVQGESVETVNDKDGMVANAWRAMQYAPDEVAKRCDWPVNHIDLAARKRRMIASMESLTQKMIGDEKYFDAEIAGYWIWGTCCWIGNGMTSLGQIPHLSDAGLGVHAIGQRPHLSNAGKGVQEPYNTNIYKWFRVLSERLRYVRVVCGDWKRVCGGNWQDSLGTVGIFFDPPYAIKDRDAVYAVDDFDVAHEVRAWSIERGDLPSYKICIAGYDEHDELIKHGWSKYEWQANGGYSNASDGKNKNREREVLWFSPHCKRISCMKEVDLFGDEEKVDKESVM